LANPWSLTATTVATLLSFSESVSDRVLNPVMPGVVPRNVEKFSSHLTHYVPIANTNSMLQRTIRVCLWRNTVL